MARDRSLSVKLRADVSNYLAGMKQAGSATREFSNRAGEGVAKHKADWAAVGQTVTVAGLAIAAGVGYAVSRFADFDQAMSAASAAEKVPTIATTVRSNPRGARASSIGPRSTPRRETTTCRLAA